MAENRDESSTGKKEGWSRRDFFKLAGTTAAAGALLSMPSWVTAGKPSTQSPETLNWEQVQDAFILDEDRIYMNIGTTGSMPEHVLEEYDRLNWAVARDPWGMEGEFGDKWPYSMAMRETLAPQFGADTEEFVITGNTTMGMNIILNGLEFKKDDVILTTNQEHIAATSPMALLRDRIGVQIVEIPVPTGITASEKEIMARFEKYLDYYRPKLLVFSHITYTTGLRLPAKKICKRANIYRVPTLVDGAHASGMLDLDFRDMGCTFYAASGHKWQCGPGGTGLLYVRNADDNDPTLWPILSSLYEYWESFGMGTALQYHGNPNYPAMQALVESCSFWEKIGRKNIEKRVLDLSAYCKDMLGSTFDWPPLYCPNDPSVSSGLTTFNPFKNTGSEDLVNKFREKLHRDYGYVIRYTHFKESENATDDTYALRISTHLFNDYDQIDGLMDAMRKVYNDMRH
ncbi:MAG: aminotransferase class V-fold PLP-dependent enzyme [Desulfovermiculus sp.]|nr:aminotransferase class V-fold PLP-dependent enzyme [Desulfovermiculus sp.]